MIHRQYYAETESETCHLISTLARSKSGGLPSQYSAYSLAKTVSYPFLDDGT